MAKNIPLPKPSQYVHDDPQQVMKTKIEWKKLSCYPSPHGPRRWRSGLERSPRKRKVGCSNPSRDRPGSDSSTAKRSAIGVCHGSSEMTKTNAPCHSRCGTQKNPRLVAMSAEHRSKFAALHWQWCHFRLSEKFSSGTKNHRQTNKHGFTLGGIRRDVRMKKTWIPFTQGCFVPNLVEIGLVVLEKKIFKFVNVFWLFRNYLPLEKGGTLYLNKLDALCQVWLKLAQWFWRRLFFKFCQYIFTIS